MQYDEFFDLLISLKDTYVDMSEEEKEMRQLSISTGLNSFYKNILGAHRFTVLDVSESKMMELFISACKNECDFYSFILDANRIIAQHIEEKKDILLSTIRYIEESMDASFFIKNRFIIRQMPQMEKHFYGFTHEFAPGCYQIAIEDQTDEDIIVVLLHELGHVVCKNLTGSFLEAPKWFIENVEVNDESQYIEIFANLYALSVIEKHNIKTSDNVLEIAAASLYNDGYNVLKNSLRAAAS